MRSENKFDPPNLSNKWLDPNPAFVMNLTDFNSIQNISCEGEDTGKEVTIRYNGGGGESVVIEIIIICHEKFI